MTLKARRPGIEIAAEWIAACCLGAAAGFAVLTLTPTGMFGAVGVGSVVAAAALAVLALVDRAYHRRGFAFEAAAFEPGQDDAGEDDAVLFDEATGEDALLLDQPVIAGEESRVVRLFGDAPQPATDRAIPAPGEMLARIEDFLGVARGSAGAAEPVSRANRANADASAALHAALADIRRSLR